MTVKKNILIVDDEQIWRDSIIEILKSYDYEINAVTNGEEALESFNRKQYDLLITEINMTGMSGLGLLRRIWETDPWTKVLIITGDMKMAFYLESMVIRGLIEYQLKPINEDELRKTVCEILSQEIDSMTEETTDPHQLEL